MSNIKMTRLLTRNISIWMYFFIGIWCLDLSAQGIKVQPGTVNITLNKEFPAIPSGPSILQIPGYFVWGGSVVKGDDGKYHMIFSLWESGPGTENFVSSWVLESKIGYAVSDFPDREFKFQKIILKGARYEGDSSAWDAQSVHNPHLKKFGDTYYLYYIGTRDPGPQTDDPRASSLNKRSRAQQSQHIGVLQFKNFEELLNGHFKRAKEPLLSPRTRVKPDNILFGSPEGTEVKPDNIIVVNPSVTYNPKTNKYMLFFKGNLYEPGWKGVHGVAIGDNPTGPFEPLDQFIFDVRMPDGSLASTEDPYVWYAKKWDCFLAVVKDFSGQLTGHKNTLALLSSGDGIHWQLPKNPLFMKRELYLQEGSSIGLSRLERPQLLLDDNGVPQVMYAACAIENPNQKNDGSTFNVHIPLAVSDTK